MIRLHILCIFLVNTSLLISAQFNPVYKPSTTNTPILSTTTTTTAREPRPTTYITRTMYGFLDFTTTVGSTVIFFSPQNEKKKLIRSSRPVASQVLKTRPPLPPPEKRPKPTDAPSRESYKEVITRPPHRLSGLAAILEKANHRQSFSPPLQSSLQESTSEGRSDNSAPRIGGTTIVPITIEGTGGQLPVRETALPISSIVVPKEVIVTKDQHFPHLSVVGPYQSSINNNLEYDQQYDYLLSDPNQHISDGYKVIDVNSVNLLPTNFPTGLVSTIAGTLVSDGQTIKHVTSVIGTHISGRYAQVLKSTSMIVNPIIEDQYHINEGLAYETVKSVIEGSATHIINPDVSSALPLESLFSETEYLEDPATLQSKLTKRRGTDPYYRQRPSDQSDAYSDYTDEYDLYRAETNLRPSFRHHVADFYHKPTITDQPLTFRPRPKKTVVRNHPSGLRLNPSKRLQGSLQLKTNRWRLHPQRPKLSINRRPIPEREDSHAKHPEQESSFPQPTPTPTIPKKSIPGEETLKKIIREPDDGSTGYWLEVATIRSLHTFRVGTSKNTRYVTFTKTFTRTSLDPTTVSEPVQQTSATVVHEEKAKPLFQNVLEASQKKGIKEIATLPPIQADQRPLSDILQTITETFLTTETLLKTSVLPVKYNHKQTSFYSLTQTYLITRIVSAIKTMPPVEAFNFIPSKDLNEFNDKLLAEGTEHEEALLPGEQEYNENTESRVKAPPQFTDLNLSELAGGKLNVEALDKELNPSFSAAIKNQSPSNSVPTPQLGGVNQPQNPILPSLTPQMTPEQLQQLAYLRLINPYMFGAFPGQQAKPVTSLSSSPVVFTTDITTVSTRVFKVIFNARPIHTTISSTTVVHTTLTTYSTTTMTLPPTLPGFGAFPFPAPLPFPTG